MLKLLNLVWSQYVLLLKHKYLYLKRFSYLYTNDFNGLGYKDMSIFCSFFKIWANIKKFWGVAIPKYLINFKGLDLSPVAYWKKLKFSEGDG